MIGQRNCVLALIVSHDKMADAAGIVYLIIWLLLAFFVGWPVSGFIFALNLLLHPFAAFINALYPLLEEMMKFFQLPYN